MFGLYLDCENNLSRHICERLYLNSTMTDIKFEFITNTGGPIEVPAHKFILSCGSSVFDSMFNGPLKLETDKIPIDDVSASAFKEFLQFFYLDEVRLTPKNIAEVVKLCKKFKLHDSITSCANSLRGTLVIDDMCWGYEIALALEEPTLIQYCEERIKQNPIEIFESESFIQCSYNVLNKILDLLLLECDAEQIVMACMKWSKAECARAKILRTPKNLRMSLDDAFSRIPFERMTLEQFVRFNILCKKMLTDDEINIINNKILGVPVEEEVSSFETIFECDRQMPETEDLSYNFGSDIFTAFSTNKQVLMKEFSAKLYGTAKYDSEICYDVSMKCLEYSTKLISGLATIVKGCDELHIILPQPVIIAAEKLHFINVYTWPTDCIDFSNESVMQPKLRNRIQKGDLKISFRTNAQFDSDSITRVIFEKSKLHDEIWREID
ncbi:BTB/POZ domain-containing protein 1-like [Contarinia nasturtii]|uniref:BTB/POZ domain-containing protein 1-like n=1 Tax=Contarinia nasturtii TaxID=265458 RepID=UPI0012D43C1D|nr:BTB/POZ domain-containing protein 1-like [Contarinia nasturtii]